MKIVVANINPEFEDLIKDLEKEYPGQVLEISKKEKLTFERLQSFNPDYIFFTHWSYMIKKDVFENFNCIVFHMTDLPYGRGGSPLQNLIVRGHKITKLSAIKVSEGLDEGDLFLKKDLSLEGSAREIFSRASKVASSMVKEIISEDLKAVPQEGDVTLFSRRKPNESDISSLKSLDVVNDYIRMLDADGYPHAFLETASLKLQFTEASLIDGKLVAKVEFSVKREG
jgi:methionyl-tRNA formyltransferase